MKSFVISWSKIHRKIVYNLYLKLSWISSEVSLCSEHNMIMSSWTELFIAFNYVLKRSKH